MWLALSQPNPSFYSDEHLLVDLHQPVVILDGETDRLTPIQYRLLVPLVEHAGEVGRERLFLRGSGVTRLRGAQN